MSETDDGSQNRTHTLWDQPRKWYLLWLPAGGLLMFAAGIVFWGGVNLALEFTNAEAFCLSCHEMNDYVYPEYARTTHYKNGMGVRATCPDCHVPAPWLPKMARKLAASNELLHKLLGTVDSREKFEARRLHLAKSVWREMAATDSRECRNCHSLLYMNLSKQAPAVQKNHSPDIARESGTTCIDCHKGVAHELPRGMDGPNQDQ